MNHKILIANKRVKNLENKYPNTLIIDLTSKSADKWVKFSPFFPHGNIPVPFSDNIYSESVEGIWQGLKVFEKEGIDISKFDVKNMKNIKRSARKLGYVLGHQKGIYDKTLLDYSTAKFSIYLDSYKWVLENCLLKEIDELRGKLEETDLLFLDYETNQNILENKPISHAFLVKLFLENRYPI